jgi:signal transduction histidine kinase
VEESAARLRGIERDLHDGAQVRLTALAMALGEIKEFLAGHGNPREALALADEAHQAAKDTLSELRDLVRGIHPPALDRGLAAALPSLTETSAIPVSLDIALAGRLSPAIEATVYFSVAELLANAAKHSGASRVTVAVRSAAAGVTVTVTDDGNGGARVTGGGGLAGLRERVRTVDGHIDVDSPAGGPTVITIELPGRP